MVTTFVLHSGKTSMESAENDLFFRQFTELFGKDDINILLCYLARPKDQWDMLTARDTEKITRQTSKCISVFVAQDAEDLFLKLDQADVLYVAGGEALHIEPFYAKLSRLKEKLHGKVYLGSSMGAFMVSTQYILSDSNQEDKSVHHGMGILPVNTLCHWNMESKKQFKIDLLRNENPTLPIVLLDEQKFVTFVY